MPHANNLVRRFGGIRGRGTRLLGEGQIARAMQAYLGHRNIQHTVRYTELAPDRFKRFWRD